MLVQGLRPVLTNYCPGAEPVEQLADDCCVHDFDRNKRNKLASNLRRRYTRELVASLSRQTTLETVRQDDLELVLGEGFTNACRDAMPNWLNHEFISVEAAICADRAIVVISNSTGMEKWVTADHVIPACDNQTESGRGCNIIDTLIEESFYSEPQRRVLPHERFDLILCLYYCDPFLS